MRLTIEMCIEGGVTPLLTVPIHAINRTCDHVQDVGLKLAEAKAMLEGIQPMVVREQLARYLVDHRACHHCGRPRTIKGYQSLRFRTAVGDVPVRNPWLLS